VLPYNRYIHCCKVKCDVGITKSRHFNIVFVPSTKNKANTVYCYVFSKGCIQEIFEDIKGTDNTMTKIKQTNIDKQWSTKYYIEN
jgi:DNA-binding transcriptional regulator WhiA